MYAYSHSHFSSLMSEAGRNADEGPKNQHNRAKKMKEKKILERYHLGGKLPTSLKRQVRLRSRERAEPMAGRNYRSRQISDARVSSQGNQSGCSLGDDEFSRPQVLCTTVQLHQLAQLDGKGSRKSRRFSAQPASFNPRNSQEEGQSLVYVHSDRLSLFLLHRIPLSQTFTVIELSVDRE
ncbi:hypothetical protein IE53DRAFT_385255 [Violaceomyces palustris]|uniref:Uncharacterized protein n=1 Tax=Violaceomyces palustris TaxID=1673888 RepID=A0ACD0P2T4_9BASI|nr:hypothetical protein IE53DRAFT_385255 [Violaceomyces palustris]